MHKNETPPNNRKLENHLLALLCSLTLVVVVATVVCVTGRGMQESGKEILSVNGTRPVKLAAEMLEKKYGWVITYEDPPYAHESELVDITEKVRRDLDKFKPGQAPKVFTPKGGELALEYEIETATKKPADSVVVVQQLLDTYAIAGNPGVFRLERDPQRLHIMVAASKNKDGVLVSRQSVLDTLITVPAQKRNGLELLDAICAAISDASGTGVVVGGAPLNRFYRHQTESGAKNQRARDFLTNELDQITGQVKWSWQLLYDPGEKTYFLNVHGVSTRSV
jgi:hypothetical protein